MGILKRLFCNEGADKFSKDFDKEKLKFKVKKDKKDKRDFHIVMAGTSYVMPKACSLLRFTTPIKNQDGVGACTGFAVTGAYEMLKKATSYELLDTSELFSYYNARVLEGTENRDVGATMRDICKTAANDGICLEQFWPFKKEKVLIKPNWIAYLSARFMRISSYYRCYDEDDIKKAITMGFPVIFGMTVYSNYMTQSGGVYNNATGTIKGGHAQVIVGYDDNVGAFIVRNSWGTSWGSGGYAWIEYKTLMKLLMDAWAIELKKTNLLQKALKAIII